MADLSSILGGMVQGFKDFGTGLVDLFGTGGAAIGDAISSIQTGRATTKNQDDFRKWLYNTDSTKDAAAKGLGTALNGVSTVADVIPGAQAVTANPLFNGLQGAIGGVSDELKMAGENADWGKAAQRAGVGAASGLASGYAGQALGKSGNKLLSNGLTRGAVSGALGGGIANAGYTGIEGGSVQDMINAGLYGAQTGALVGGTTGLARELIKPNYKMDAALSDDERKARIANIDDQLAKLDTSTQEGIDRHNELMMARIKYEQPQEYMMSHRPTRSGIYADDLLAEGEDGLSYPKDVYDKPQNYTFMYTDTPAVMNETMAQLNAVRGNPNGEVTIYRATPGDTINDGDWITLSESYAKLHNDTQLGGKGNVLSQKVNVRDIQPAMDDLAEWGYFPQKKATKTVADLMNEPKQKTVADLMLSPEQEEFFKDSQLRDENGKLMRVYHSSPNKFTEFDDARLGNNTAYDNTAFGHFVTNDRDFSSRFRDIDNRGIDGYTMELYANAKKPITHPYEAAYKYSGDELDNIVKNYYKETDNPEALAAIKEWADESGQSLYEAYMDMSVDENPFEMAAAERKALQGKGYDAVEFVEGRKSGLVDGSTDETPISSYAIFSGNQLKDIKNRKPTSNPNINYALAGLLGTGGLAAAMAAATPKEDKKKKSEVK